jgi:hypothetical protein
LLHSLQSARLASSLQDPSENLSRLAFDRLLPSSLTRIAGASGGLIQTTLEDLRPVYRFKLPKY